MTGGAVSGRQYGPGTTRFGRLGVMAEVVPDSQARRLKLRCGCVINRRGFRLYRWPHCNGYACNAASGR